MDLSFSARKVAVASVVAAVAMISTGAFSSSASLQAQLQNPPCDRVCNTEEASMSQFLGYFVRIIRSKVPSSDAAYDVNNDGVVNISDVLTVQLALQQYKPEHAALYKKLVAILPSADSIRAAVPHYDVKYDMNGDGVVNISDVLARPLANIWIQSTSWCMLDCGGTSVSSAPSLPFASSATSSVASVSTCGDKICSNTEKSTALLRKYVLQELRKKVPGTAPGFDTNSDGVMNINDPIIMYQALARYDSKYQRAYAVIPNLLPTIEAIQMNFGSIGGRICDRTYDLNGDGVVNISDVLQRRLWADSPYLKPEWCLVDCS